jgi:hypothetical protein
MVGSFLILPLLSRVNTVRAATDPKMRELAVTGTARQQREENGRNLMAIGRRSCGKTPTGNRVKFVVDTHVPGQRRVGMRHGLPLHHRCGATSAAWAVPVAKPKPATVTAPAASAPAMIRFQFGGEPTFARRPTDMGIDARHR